MDMETSDELKARWEEEDIQFQVEESELYNNMVFTWIISICILFCLI